MRKISTTSLGSPKRASEECPWCKGRSRISVPDMKMIESLGTIYDVVEKGYVAFIPRISVSCPICFPDGMRLSDRRVMSTLSMYADKAYECYPREYWQLLGTIIYLDLRTDQGGEYALEETCRRVRGFRGDYLLPRFIEESPSRHPINFKPKTFK